MPIPLIMHGAAGRMGRRILSLAAARPDEFRIVAGVDRQAGTLRELGIDSDAPLLERLPDEPGAVVVDFSQADAVGAVLAHCAAHAMAAVVGTTGVEPGRRDALVAEAAARVPVLWAPNMAIGVNVVFATAARLARSLGGDYDIEIVEAHHHHKVDAPSGTAFGIADAVLEATGRTRADLAYGRSGAVGERRKGEIGIHALRMGDVVGDHTVYFVGNGERVVLGHVAHDRDIFARGALRAAAYVAGREPGSYAMADVLGL